MIQQIQQSILQMKEEKNIFLFGSQLPKQRYHGNRRLCRGFLSNEFGHPAIRRRYHFSGRRAIHGETAKILAPNKTVILVTPDAGCPMAEQIEPSMIEAIKAQHPEYKVVAYINTTAALKAVCDVCVTSSTAVKIVKALEETEILFIPDCNLGGYVQKQVPERI